MKYADMSHSKYKRVKSRGIMINMSYNNDIKIKKNERLLSVIKLCLLVLLVAVLPLILYLTNKEFFMQFKSIEAVQDYISKFGNMGALIFVGFQVFQVVVSVIPGEIFQVAAGFLFGHFKGFLLAMLGCLIGEIFCFWLARFLGKDFIRLFISEEKLSVYRERLNSKRAYTICFLLYLLPGIPKDIICYIAGITEIDFARFIAITMAARIPGVLGSIMMGSLIQKNQYHIALAILAAACIIAALGYIFRNKISAYIDRLKGRRE